MNSKKLKETMWNSAKKWEKKNKQEIVSALRKMHNDYKLKSTNTFFTF